MTETNVAVVGGSVGGCCAAIALRAAGCAPTIHEREPGALRSRGAGIVVHGDFADFLARRDVGGPEAVAVPSGRRTAVARDGTVTVVDETRRWMTSYDALLAGLLAATDGVPYRTGSPVEGPEDDAVRDADLVVAADGAGSVLRRTLLPEVAPAYTGYVAWRGLVDEPYLPESVRELAGDFAFFTDPEPAPFPTQILSYLVPGPDGELDPGARRLNWVWYQPIPSSQLSEHLTDADGHVHEWSLPPEAMDADVVARRRALARERLPGAYADLVEATPAPSVQAITDLSSPRAVLGRTALIGDAAFVVRPHTLYGSSKAAMDADALATAIAGHPGDVDAALASWEPGQLRRGNAVVAHGTRLGREFGLGSGTPAAPAR